MGKLQHSIKPSHKEFIEKQHIFFVAAARLKSLLAITLILSSSFLSAQNTILWKVTHEGNKHISYLLGTHHEFGKSFVDSFPLIQEKLSVSGLLITEVKYDRPKIFAYYNSRPSSDTIFSILSKEDIEMIVDVLKQGQPEQVDISKFTPGEIFMKLAGYYAKMKCPSVNNNNQRPMDAYIQQIGEQQHKTSYYLETDTFQLEQLAQAAARYNWTSFKQNVPILLNAFRAEPIANNPLCNAINQYISMNLDYKFEKSCAQLQSSGPEAQLIRQRNGMWMQKLPLLLENNNCFVAVGLGHFFYDCGIIQLLRDLGYNIEPVSMK